MLGDGGRDASPGDHHGSATDGAPRADGEPPDETGTWRDPIAWELLVERIPDAVSLHDAEGTYRYVSQAFADMFGWDPEQVVGRDPYLLFHPDDVSDVQAAHAATLEDGSRPSVQYRLRCADGSYRWVETTSRLTPDEAIVMVTRLISDRRSLLHALDNERMVAERLREVERERQAFLTAISHRARHPMTALAGFAQLLQSGRVVEEAARQAIYDRLVANTQRLSELIEAATTADELSRRANALRRRPVDLDDLVRELASEFWDLDHPNDTTVSLETAGRGLVFADRERLAVAVRALYHNAVKHTPVGTRVWVRVEQHPHGRLLVVEDDGPGVPDMLKSAIFDRLTHGETGHSHPDPGLGLGLFLVDQIARAHDGRAWVEDREGGGASFRVLLPVAQHRRRPVTGP